MSSRIVAYSTYLMYLIHSMYVCDRVLAMQDHTYLAWMIIANLLLPWKAIFKLKGYHYQPNMYLNIHLMLTIMAAPSTGIGTGIRLILFGGSGIGKDVI